MNARIDLTVRKAQHFLGENVLVNFCVVNPSSTATIKIDVGGDYRGSTRSLRFKLEVRDDAGVLVPDPDPDPWNEGGLGYAPEIAPGKRWCQSLPLARYARIEKPGAYTVRATHDLGWPQGTAPFGTVVVHLALPTAAEAEAVITAMEKLPADPSTSAGQTSIDYQDFSSLAYEVYVAPLTARARAGKENAVFGLAQIPAVSATRALIGLLGDRNPAIARAAAGGLAMRLPDPALGGALGKRNPFDNEMTAQRKFLSSRAWDPSLANDVRAAAIERLASGDQRGMIDGAFMLEAVGVAGDGLVLTAALNSAIDDTRTRPAEEDIYPPPRGANMELLRAATILVGRGFAPAAAPKRPGEIAVWLVALDAGARPSGWEKQLGKVMTHPIPFVRELALDHAPDALPAQLMPIVRARLADGDLDVLVAAAELARRAKLTALAPDLVKAMSRTTGIRLSIVSNAAQMLGRHGP